MTPIRQPRLYFHASSGKTIVLYYAVATWPVTGQGFQNTKWPAVLIFSVNVTNRKSPAKQNYHMSIKRSQAILKCFIDLKNSVWLTICSHDERENIGTCTAGHLVFSTPWPAVELEKVLSVTKHGFVFWTQRKPNSILEIYKAFQDRLTSLNRHMIV